ncbi:MAG: ParA family protein [Porticoccaceae bacterium]|nr:ParA family protein [Porticoccaceae bacterium]
MTRIYTIANQKGGVGKTTTSVNLAASLATYGKRVLLVDMDPQGNATMGSGVDKNSLEASVYDVIVGKASPEQAIRRNDEAQMDILPANRDLTAAEVELLQLAGKENRLRHGLIRVSANYDYIIIDCPPSLSMLTINALAACQGVIIPVQCEYYALEGLSDLVGTIKRIAKVINPSLQVSGILRTMYDPRSSLTNEVSSQLHQFFGDRVYRTTIPRNVRLAEAPSYGKPANIYDRSSRGAIAYLGLAGEIIRRNKEKAG